jgi:hypothetical protein
MVNKQHITQHNYDLFTSEWNDSLTGEYLWSNVNISEAVPDGMTPSTWSLWRIFHYDANPIKMPGNAPFCGNICRRPYLNLSLLASLYKAIRKDIRKELQGDLWKWVGDHLCIGGRLFHFRICTRVTSWV